MIEAIEGQKKIRDIAVGDLVASRDAFTGAKTFRTVTDLFRRTAPGIVHVTLDGPDGKRETLDVTSEHPLFAEGKGWTQVRRLQKGDRVLSGKGGPLAVADIVHDNTPTLVYNFEVAQDHSYFAGSEGAWSHNGFGSYLVGNGSQFYIGKGDLIRAKRSARRIGGWVIDWTPACSDKQSFIDEARRILDFGGIGAENLLNIRNSPGRKWL